MSKVRKLESLTDGGVGESSQAHVPQPTRPLFSRINSPSWHPQPIDRWRTKAKNGYVFDRRVFIGYMLVVIALGVFVWYDEFGWHMTTERVWQHCPSDSVGPCENPMYLQCDKWYCREKTWPVGYEYGEPPGWWYTNYSMIALFLGIIAAVINHVVWNRAFKIEVN